MFRFAIGKISSAAILVSAAFSAFAEDPDLTTVRKERLEEMRRRAAALVVTLGEGKAARVCEPAKEPVLRFNDAARDFHDGTLWSWTNRGRPFLLVSLERYEKGWSYELISLTSDKMSLADGSGWVWKPEPADAVGRTIADAPAPAATSAARQRQARSLSRRFAAVGFVAGGAQRTELRLQPHPIHQYQDLENGLLDGAFFIFSTGTNPEVLLIVEAIEDKKEGARWQYALARVSTGELEATLDEAKVWRVEWLSKPRAQQPYTYFTFPLGNAPKNRE